MRVLIITNMPTPHQVDLFDALDTLESIDLTVVYTRRMSAGRHWAPPDQLRHRHLFLTEFRLKDHWYINPDIRSLFRSIRAADLIIIGQYASLTTQIAMYNCSLSGKPWVFWSEAVGGVEYAERPLLRSDFLRRWLRRLALFPVRHWPAAYWAVGEKARHSFEAEFPGSSKPCLLYPYYSDLADFFGIERDEIRKDGMTFLFSGSLIYRKGFDMVVDAVRSLLAEGYTSFKILVVGVGEQRELVGQDQLPYFDFRGFVTGAGLIQQYKNAQVCLFPSRYDGWGMSLVEALAAGLPVISTHQAGAAAEILRNGINGWFSRELTAMELAASMKYCLDNPDLVAGMVYECRRSVEKYHVTSGAERFLANVKRLNLKG